jgi:hypothetical protein
VKAITKIAIVGAAYLGAFLLASLAVSVYIAATAGTDRYTYGALFAFGDGLYFLGAFGLAAIPATAIALFFLRPYPKFWRAASAIAVLIVAVTILAAISNLTSFQFKWLALAPLFILLAPLPCGAFLLSALFAPSKRPRLVLLLAGLTQGVTFGFAILVWGIHAGG